jgi:ABC-type sulfate/molybdate transport systems ATPase subunit
LTEAAAVGDRSAMLECRGVSKRISNVDALRSTSFAIAEGEHLAVTGPSGSGKTTLVRILAGLLEPSAGEVLESGARVNGPGFREPPHLRRIGVLFQGLALWPHLTVLGNVELSIPRGAASEDAPPGRRERRLRAAAILADVGLSALSRRYPRELSGGERQRVAWARAVAGEPRLLFLDEPLTSLDPRLRAELLELVVQFGERPGRTLVVVTHDADLAKRLGRRVLDLGATAR